MLSRVRAVGLTVVLSTLLVCSSGCWRQDTAFENCERQRLTAEEQIRDLKQQLADTQEANRRLQGDLARLRNQSPESAQDLIAPESIQLEALSGGYDRDGAPGDDGIVLYIQPLDRDGSVVKAAGTIDVRLLDLARPDGASEIGSYHFDVEQTRQMWYGRMWTHHFTAYCPFHDGKVPSTGDVTALVTFTDLLTGKALRAQAAYKVKVPASATFPASG